MAESSRQLSQEQVAQFLDLLKNLELEEIVVTRMGFELLSPLKEGTITVRTEERIEPPSLEGQRLKVLPAFTIVVAQEEKERFQFQAQYLLVFSVKNRDTVSNVLENKEVLGSLFRQQVLKLIWPFLRADFHFACSKLGIHPITLKLLR